MELELSSTGLLGKCIATCHADAVSTYFQPEDSTSDSVNHEPSPRLEGDGCREAYCDAPENPPSKKMVTGYVYVCNCASMHKYVCV